MNHSEGKRLGLNFISGSSYMISAEAIYFLAGYMIHIVAASQVSPLDYGRFGIIMSLMGLIYVLLGTGLPESLTKHISEGFDARQTYFLVLKYQVVVSLILFILLFFSSSYISDLLGDEDLEVYIKSISFLIILRSIFHINRGFLNGLSKFGLSSIMSIVNNISKSFLSILFLLMGYGIFSMIGSYMAATLLAIIISFIFIYSIEIPSGKQIKSANLFVFTIPLIIFTICHTIMDSTGIFFIKSMITDPNTTGYFNSAKVLSSTIVTIGFAISYTTLPTASKIYSTQNHYAMQNFIGNIMRYLFLILCPIIICIYLTSNELISFFFPNDYVAASRSLEILIISSSFFAVFIVQASIINGTGNPKLPMIISLLLIPLFIILNIELITRYGMVGSPLSSLICNIIGTIILTSFLFHKYQTFILLKNIKFFFTINLILFLFIYKITSIFQFYNFTLILLYLFSGLVYIYSWYLIEFKNGDKFNMVNYVS